jgi:hypothetical protein
MSAPTLYLGYTIYDKQVQLLCYFTYFNVAYFNQMTLFIKNVLSVYPF